MRLLAWIVPSTPVYWLERSGDILEDMVQALEGLRREMWRMIEGTEPHIDPCFRRLR